MQINNIKTGEVVKVKFDDIITYFTYGADTDVINSDATQIKLDNIINNTYNELVLKLGADFEISESNLNWVVKTGSTGNDTIYRVTLPSLLLGQTAYSDNILDQLVQSIKPLEAFAVRVKGKNIQYLETIESSAKEILFSFFNEGVKIEKLITDENGIQTVLEITDINNL